MVSNLKIIMQTNPFSYQLPGSKIRTISCHSKSDNYQMAIIVLETNNAIVFTGSGKDSLMKTADGATSVLLPPSTVAKKATIIFFSHPILTINPTYTLVKSVKDPTQNDRPYGILINIISENEAGTEECGIVLTLN